MMWDQYDQFSWWWFAVMPLAMLAFWALVAWLVFTVVRPGPEIRPAPPRAEAILAERYARGELDADDYYRRLHDLDAASAERGGGS
jgi:putative membrane protein